jgi:hypothetical protein
MSFHKHVIASATDVSGGDADFDFERFFNPFPQFEALLRMPFFLTHVQW